MDAERFACVLEQYPTSLPNRRLMYIDRLLREMPHKTRTEIVSMGSPHSAYPIPSQFTMHTLYVTGCPRLPASAFMQGWRLGTGLVITWLQVNTLGTEVME